MTRKKRPQAKIQRDRQNLTDINLKEFTYQNTPINFQVAMPINGHKPGRKKREKLKFQKGQRDMAIKAAGSHQTGQSLQGGGPTSLKEGYENPGKFKARYPLGSRAVGAWRREEGRHLKMRDDAIDEAIAKGIFPDMNFMLPIQHEQLPDNLGLHLPETYIERQVRIERLTYVLSVMMKHIALTSGLQDLAPILIDAVHSINMRIKR
ncbi:uncharacterized protein KY384_008780 [Bacidia gigantensis]|uniref:uncharacterized protein n=1 Tax=Bacidia gigantensis TaxID=2732470 RepID=UPI001D04BCA5|nr:uncharacterized protein KY384_008780 [Bacidia gigantensis]KAG8526579.1 hypothetical protein KY384_008780 [Bacidia gigantensis]